MKEILDAILASDTERPDVAGIAIPESYKGIVVRKDEQDMFAGMASRGEEAIELARQLDPQLILMDVRLEGEIDGITAAETIRDEHDVPVVFLTAHADDDTLHRATRTEASAYLVKPFKPPDLRCVIEIALHKHAADVRLRENERWLELQVHPERRRPAGEYPSFDGLMAERDRMFAAHPRTTFIAAHMFLGVAKEDGLVQLLVFLFSSMFLVGAAMLGLVYGTDLLAGI